jgi:hypothetical protein
LKIDCLVEWMEICFVYLTVPYDMSTSMIVNYQLFGPKPSMARVIFNSSQIGNKIPKHLNLQIVNSTCFHMTENPEEERYHCWADLTTLTPETTYYVTPEVELSDGQIIKGETLKFRTAPSLTSNTEIKYINGGDLAWNEAGELLSKQAAEQEPLFALIGGDIAYENGDPNCYRRYDMWFKKWMRTMVTPTNYSIPILSAIGKRNASVLIQFVGNHDAGGFKKSRSESVFYLRFFPHEIHLQHVDPFMRNTTHVHLFASHTV